VTLSQIRFVALALRDARSKAGDPTSANGAIDALVEDLQLDPVERDAFEAYLA